MGRGRWGLEAYAYDPATGLWSVLPGMGEWSDANGWDQVQYYRTIQAARALRPGDPLYTGDGTHPQDVVLARGTYGVETWRYQPASQSWTYSSPFPAFTGGLQAAYTGLGGKVGLHTQDIRTLYTQPPGSGTDPAGRERRPVSRNDLCVGI